MVAVINLQRFYLWNSPTEQSIVQIMWGLLYAATLLGCFPAAHGFVMNLPNIPNEGATSRREMVSKVAALTSFAGWRQR